MQMWCRWNQIRALRRPCKIYRCNGSYFPMAGYEDRFSISRSCESGNYQGRRSTTPGSMLSVQDRTKKQSIWTRDLSRTLPPPVVGAFTTKDMPPFLVASVRSLRIMVFVCLGLLALQAFVPLVEDLWGCVCKIFPRRMRSLAYGATVLLALCIWLLSTRRVRRFRQRVRSSDYELCLECGYSLTGLGDRRACPECGVDFTIEDVREKWRHWLRQGKASGT